MDELGQVPTGPYPAALSFPVLDEEAMVDLLLQFLHVGNDAHDPVFFAQLLQGLKNKDQTFPVQVPKPSSRKKKFWELPMRALMLSARANAKQSEA